MFEMTFCKLWVWHTHNVVLRTNLIFPFFCWQIKLKQCFLQIITQLSTFSELLHDFLRCVTINCNKNICVIIYCCTKSDLISWGVGGSHQPPPPPPLDTPLRTFVQHVLKFHRTGQVGLPMRIVPVVLLASSSAGTFFISQLWPVGPRSSGVTKLIAPWSGICLLQNQFDSCAS